MKNNHKFIALIPAKKNSQTVKNKNMFIINNKPLIYYTINESKKSKMINDIYISTDSKKIIDYGKKFNVNVINRPKKYSSNNSLAKDVIKHFIKSLNSNYSKNDTSIIYLQPTSPLRKAHHINAAIKIYLKNKNSSLISVTDFKHTPFKSLLLKKNKLFPFLKEKYLTANRQQFPKLFRPNGAIYIFRINDFIKKGSIPITNSIPFIMNNKESVDFDDFEDLNKIKKLIK